MKLTTWFTLIRTYVIDSLAGEFALEASPAQNLFLKLARDMASCVISAVEPAQNNQELETPRVFVASDSVQLTQTMLQILQGQLPYSEIRAMSQRPAHSSRLMFPGASEEEYVSIWATWFGLLHAQRLCCGYSMFAESVQSFSSKLLEVSHFGSCIQKALSALARYTLFVTSRRVCEWNMFETKTWNYTFRLI